MNEKMSHAYSAFQNHFGYTPEFPEDVFFDQDEYAKLLYKCVNDNFDYTIEKYGTIPKKSLGLPKIIID